jgi:tetratricopeptide (TPR) repeat protein
MGLPAAWHLRGNTVKYSVLIGILLLSFAGPAAAQLQALPGLKQAAQAAPRDAQAQRAYGRALIRAGRYDDAERQMKVLVKLEAESFESLYELARVRFEEGNYKKARAACHTMMMKDSKQLLSQLCMAQAFLAWRRASRAEEHLDAALEVDPNHYETLLALGAAKRMEGAAAESQAAYEKALQVNPTGAAAQLGLGRLQLASGKPDAAKATLYKARELDPNDPELLYELGKLERGAPAVQLLDAALANRAGWPEATLALGHAKLQAGELAGARSLFEQVLKKGEDGGAIFGLAQILIAEGDLAKAEPLLKRAAELLPSEPGVALAQAKLYEKTERDEEAFAEYQRAATLNLKDPEPLVASGRLARRLKRTLLAGAFLDKAIERAPRHAQALAERAELFAALGDNARAREYYQRALSGEGTVDRAALSKQLAALK